MKSVIALVGLLALVSASSMAKYPSVERLMIETQEGQTVEGFWPWSYPESACIGELWYTPLFSYFGLFNQYYWSDFNLVTFNDAKDLTEDSTCNNGQAPPALAPGGLECGVKVGGRVAVGGDLIVNTEGSIGHDTQTSPGGKPYCAVINGDFGWPAQAGNLYPKTENIFVGGEVIRTDPNTPAYIRNRIRGNCHSGFLGSCLSLPFQKAYWYYKMVQVAWAWHPTNCINELRTEWDGKTLILTAAIPDQDRYYLTIPEDCFEDLKSIELVGFPKDAEFVVTVQLTKDLTISNVGKFPALVGNYPGRVVYSFCGAYTVTISDSRLPSVLAPDARLNQKSGRIQGFAIADTVEELGTVHIVDCTESGHSDKRKAVNWF